MDDRENRDSYSYASDNWDISLFLPKEQRPAASSYENNARQRTGGSSSRGGSGHSTNRRAAGASSRPRSRAAAPKTKRFTFGLLIYYILTFYMMELVYRLWLNTDAFFGVGLFYSFLYSAIGGAVCYALSTFLRKTPNFWITVILTEAVGLLFSVQLVYYSMFQTPLLLDMLNEAGGAAEFAGNAVMPILKAIPAILCFHVLPLVVLFKWGKKKFVFLRTNIRFKGLVVALCLLAYLVSILTIALGSKGDMSPYQLYFKMDILDGNLAHSQAFGVQHTAAIDVFRSVFGFSGGSSAGGSDIQGDDPTKKNESEEPENPGIDTSPNVMDIDFDTLIANESDSTVKAMHQYFQSVEPTKKNAYTGMFKDYNLIYITAEALSPYCIAEDVTPTLYKMVHSGWEFTNYYSPLLGISTTDGEWGNCTGLFPTGYLKYNGSKMLAFKYTGSAKTYLPFCLGNQFSKLNYAHVWAYHDHTSTYYARNISHPNMGYNYQGYGSDAATGGLPVKYSWPESDLEMMQVTLPKACEQPNFHLYYMTVSGHMNYSFEGNRMSSKHKAEIQALRPNLSAEAQAYLACNMELDKAMEYTLDYLKQVGKLDKTIIVMSCDHYPYGLKYETMSEFLGHTVDQKFEMFENNLILYNPGLEHEVFSKPMYHLDLLPTVSNLFGLEYDSRLLAGRDYFSDCTPLVVFQNGSWMTDKVRYDASTGKATSLCGEPVDSDYVAYYKKAASNRKKYSKLVIQYDYFRKVFPNGV